MRSITRSRLERAQGPDARPVVYKGQYAGWYCPRCEGFKTEAELRQPGNLCADHQRPCEWTEEENLFFRLSAFQGWLREEIEAGRFMPRRVRGSFRGRALG